MTALQLDDIQGLILKGYFRRLPRACYLWLRAPHASALKTWLAALRPSITPASRQAPQQVVNLALSAQGMQKLLHRPLAPLGFRPEFVDGMTTAHRRRMLGDHGRSAPEQWHWGGPGRAVDALLILFNADAAAAEQALTAQRRLWQQAGLEAVYTLASEPLPGNKEHFGFRDGIAQPAIRGYKQDTPADLQPGEFILGYRNEYGEYPLSPLIAMAEDAHARLPIAENRPGYRDLGANGSYLVVRQLYQDVGSFWAYQWRRFEGLSLEQRRREALTLAAKMVGRWPDGEPLARAPNAPPAADDPRFATDLQKDEFQYQRLDPHGYRCPLGAHIRRANPRDALQPWPGFWVSRQMVRHHRIIRRGRPFGPALNADFDFHAMMQAGPDPVLERGLLFACINADIGRQFEMIQHSWLNNPKFNRLTQNPDPIGGQHTAALAGREPGFTVEAEPIPRHHPALQAFVTASGGGYFFLPALNALKFLA